MSEADYEKLVKSLTDMKVALTENGEYRSTYDILKDIAAQWKNLTSMEQAALTEALAGTRMQSVFSSIIGQFQEASGAMEAMSNSSGELRESYAAYMESAEAHINQLKAAFESLAQSLFNSDSIKTVADMLAGLLTTLDNLVRIIGGVPTIITGIAAAMSAFGNVGILNLFKKGFNFVNALKSTSAFSFSPGLSKSLNQDIIALQNLQTAVNGGISKTEALNRVMAGASATAKNFAENNKLTRASIHNFAIEQRQAQVSVAAQSASLKSQFSIIRAYNSSLSSLKLNEKQFVEAVRVGNPFLGDYLSKVKAGEASTVRFALSLARSKAAALGLKIATLALNTALTMLVSVGVSFALNKIIEKANEAKDSIDKTADSINDLHESVKTLDEYQSKAVELREELDKGSLSIEDVTQKRKELFDIQKQLIGNYGDEAKKIDFVNGSIKEQIELYDKLKDKEAEDWLDDNAIGIQNARKFLYTDSPNPQTQYLILSPEKEGYAATTGGDGQFTGVSKFLADWVSNTSNAKWETTGTGEMRILLNGGRKNILKAYDDLFDKLKQYKETQENLTEQDIKNIEALQVAISGAKKYITDNDSYDKSVQAYEQATEYVAQTDSAYKKFYDNISNYQKEYNDAVAQGNDKVAEELSVKVQSAYKDLFDKADFSGTHNGVYGEDIKAYFENQLQDFVNLSVPVRLKVDIEGTKREFDSSYEELAEIYAKVGDEGFNFGEDSFDILEHYNEVLKEAKELGVDLNKTVFGNIDTNNRQPLEWTEENLNKYKDAYESLGWTAEELKGSISTVMGMADEFDGVNIAFTPMLQTDHGAVLLDENTVYEYIWALIDQMPEGWTNEDLLKLDARGIEMDGQKIKGLIADIGDTAIKTSESMHFAGKDGAIADAYKYWQEYVKENNLSNISVDQASEFNAIRDAAKEAGVSIESYIDALVQYGKVKKTAASPTEDLSISKYSEDIKKAQDSISPLLDAYEKLQKGELSNSDIVTLISDKFPSLIQYTDNLSVGIQRLAKEKLEELKTKLDAVDKSKLSESDLKAYEKFIEYIDSLNDGFNSTLAYYEKIQSQTKSVSDSITTLIGLSKEIEENGSLSLSSVEKIMSDDTLTSLRPYLNDVKTMLPIINNLISDQKQAYEDLYNEQQRLADPDAYLKASQQKQQEDEDAFQNSVKRVSDQIAKFKEKYGVDLTNWDKLEDDKKSILQNTNAELLSKQWKLINDFKSQYNVDLTNFKNAQEAKAAIVDQFRTTDIFNQATNILDEFGTSRYNKYTMAARLAADKTAQAKIDKLFADNGSPLTWQDFREFLLNEDFTPKGSELLKKQLNEIVNAYVITPTTWDDMTKNIGTSGGSSKSSGETSTKEETWFDKDYKEHNHKVKMKQETDANYLDWLEGAYKQAYREGIIDLDAYYKYEEEVFAGRERLRDAEENWFERSYGWHSHRVKVGKESERDYLDWLETAYKQAYKEGLITLDEYRRYEEEVYEGRKKFSDDSLSWFEKEYKQHQHNIEMGTETHADYLKWLKGAYEQAYKEGIITLDEFRKYQEEIYKGTETLKNNAESAIKELVNIRINMLKEEINEEREALDKRIDALKDFYQKQKDMLQDKYDEEKYLENQADKRKKVSDIDAELEQLRFDDSAKAQKLRAKLTEEREEAQKDLDDFEKDHALDVSLNYIDSVSESEVEALNKEKEALEKTPKELYDQALSDIRNGSSSLYKEMIEWNNKYGDGIRDTIRSAWEEAYKAEKDYFEFTGKHFNNVHIVNATGYSKTKKSGYASGTSYATSGIHRVDENGVETIFQSADGQRYRMFSAGEKVLNVEASDFLYKFANHGKEILESLLNKSSCSGMDKFRPVIASNEIRQGDIIIQGNVDKSTVSEIRRAQRESLEQILKQFNMLK